MTKSELLSKMREHQQEYAKYAAEYKALSLEEEKKEFEERQRKRLEEFKTKYKFLIQDDNSIKEIDFVEIEKLVLHSPGYALGFDQTGQEGLGYEAPGTSHFTPMVEDEVEAERFLARDVRRKEFIAKAKGR